MNQAPLWTKSFLFISAGNFFFILTHYALLVTLPTAAITYFGSTGAVAGLFTTVFISAAIIVRPFMGPCIDRYGKRVILLASLLIFTIASLTYSFFESILPFLILRFIHGLGFGMATTITVAIVADMVPEARQGEGMGYFVLSANLAMVAGPIVGLTTFDMFTLKIFFLVAAFCSLISLSFGLLTKVPKKVGLKHSGSEKRQAFVEKSAIPISITGAFLGIAFASILSFMAVFAIEQGLGTASSYFFAVYVGALLLTRPYTGRWYDQYGANVIIFPAIVSFAIGMFVLGMTTSALLFFIAAAFIGIGWGTLFPSFQTVVIQNAKPERRPVAMATFFSIFDIGIAGGSLLVGALVGMIDLGTLYLFCSVYILFGLAVYYWAQNKSTEVPMRVYDTSSLKKS